MDVEIKKCAWCGKEFYKSDGRYKYCSPECNQEAHRAKCRERFRIRYVEKHDAELARYKRYYREHTEEVKARATNYIKARRNNE